MRAVSSNDRSARVHIVLSVCLAGILVATAPEPESKGPFKNLEYRLIGPAASGCVSRVAGVPGDLGRERNVRTVLAERLAD